MYLKSVGFYFANRFHVHTCFSRNGLTSIDAGRIYKFFESAGLETSKNLNFLKQYWQTIRKYLMISDQFLDPKFEPQYFAWSCFLMQRRMKKYPNMLADNKKAPLTLSKS